MSTDLVRMKHQGSVSMRGVRLIAAVAALALIAAACNGGGEETTTSTDGVTTTAASTPTSAPAAEGATFRVGFPTNVTTANWFAALDTESKFQNRAFLTNMKPALFGLSKPGFVHVSDMADGAAVAAVQEGDLWTVIQPIKRDRIWSDGTPVTANDLVFYFELVREFRLGSNHPSSFPPAVLAVEAPDDYTVKITFANAPGLALWQSGVGLASWVPAHYWVPVAEEARAAAAAAGSLGDEDAAQAIIDASRADDDPANDLTREALTQAEIDSYIARVARQAGRTVLYTHAAVGEPSAGPIIFGGWEPGAFVATAANDDYAGRGDVNTLYADGSFGIRNPETGKDEVYGGSGSGDVIAEYVEGPSVGEILWVEHASKEEALEQLAAGELDFVLDRQGLSTEQRSRLAENPDLSIAASAAEDFHYLAFNLRKDPMNDLAFRQALATLIDKEFMAESVFAGSVLPAYTVVHPGLSFWHNPDVPRPGWEAGGPLDEAGRADRAIQILRDAGYTWDVEPTVVRDGDGAFSELVPGSGLTMPDGTTVPELILLTTTPEFDTLRSTYGEWVAQWAEGLGITVRVEPTEFHAIQDQTIFARDLDTALSWDLYILGWGGGDPSLPGASQVAFFHSLEETVTAGGFNSTGFDSAEFDAAADDFEAATGFEAARAATFEMEKIIADQLPYVVLFRTLIFEAYRNDVRFPVAAIMGGHGGFPNAWANAVEVGG